MARKDKKENKEKKDKKKAKDIEEKIYINESEHDDSCTAEDACKETDEVAENEQENKGENSADSQEDENSEKTCEEKLVEAEGAVKEWQERYLRLHAEWDTYRRRTNERRAEERVRATEALMEDLLPVLDDFERSVKYAEEHGEVGLLDGVKAIQNKLSEILSKHGLEMIDPTGQPFDALESAAVATVPDDSVYDETVAEVYQKGYRMGKKILRSAMVTVTTGGPRRPAESEEDK